MKRIGAVQTAVFAVGVAQENLQNAIDVRIEAVLHARELGATWAQLARETGLSAVALRRLAARHSKSSNDS